MTFRYAEEKDTALIFDFINKLAVYEKMQDEVVCDEAMLKKWIFDKKGAQVIFVMDDKREVGFALFFKNFSTFLGKSGLYLEDLFVLEEERGKGYGKALLKKLAQIAKQEDLGRFEWACLDWNTPSIDFYKAQGAKHMKGWMTFRLSGDALNKFAEEK